MQRDIDSRIKVTHLSSKVSGLQNTTFNDRLEIKNTVNEFRSKNICCCLKNLGKWNNDDDAIATQYLFYVTKNEDLKNAIIFGSSAKTLPSFSNAFDPSVLVPFARKRIGVYMKRRVFPPFLNILHHFYHY